MCMDLTVHMHIYINPNTPITSRIIFDKGCRSVTYNCRLPLTEGIALYKELSGDHGFTHLTLHILALSALEKEITIRLSPPKTDNAPPTPEVSSTEGKEAEQTASEAGNLTGSTEPLVPGTPHTRNTEREETTHPCHVG